MTIDWNIVATIASPIIALFVGAWINQIYNRTALISYFSNVSSFRYTPQGGQQTFVNTHSVVLRNAGRTNLTNVRIHHLILPDYNLFPGVVHNVEELPDGTKDIVVPLLVAGEEITISYLYFPPVDVNQVNAGIKCDQGFANQINVLLQRQYPRWFNLIVLMLMVIGLITVFYLIYKII